MIKKDIKQQIEDWMKQIAWYKAEIELAIVTTKNGKVRENLCEATADLAKAYNMLLAAFKEINEG